MRGGGAEEAAEETLFLGSVDSDAFVLDGNLHRCVADAACGDGDRAAVRGVLDRVGKEISDDLSEALFVADEGERLGRELEPDRMAGASLAEEGDLLLEQKGEVEVARRQAEAAVFDVARVKQVVDEAGESL